MFSFLAERKGAKEITSVDLYVDEKETQLNMTNGWNIGRIQAIKKVVKSDINIRACSIYELEKLDKQFDVVFCGNVLAWLDYPIMAIRKLADITKQTLIIREDISKIKGKAVLEYVNNENLSTCMFNGNEKFYINYLTALGFKKITFKRVDEFEIYKKRNIDFPLFTINKGVKIFRNPFTNQEVSKQLNQENCRASSFINNYYFFNYLGWIKEEDVQKVKIKARSFNTLKQFIFKKKFNQNMLDNCMVFAEK